MTYRFIYPEPVAKVRRTKPTNTVEKTVPEEDPYEKLLKKIEDDYNILGELTTIIFNDQPIDGFSKRIVKGQSIITHFNNMIVQTTKYNHRTTIVKDDLDIWMRMSDNVLAKKALNFPIIYSANIPSGHIYYENSIEAYSLPTVLNGMFGPKDLERDILELQICMIYIQLASQGFIVDSGDPRLALIKIPNTSITYLYNSISITVNVSYVVLLLPTTKIRPGSQYEAYTSYLKYLNANWPQSNHNIYSSFVESIICRFSKLFLIDKKASKYTPMKSLPIGVIPITIDTEVGSFVYIPSIDKTIEGFLLRNDKDQNNVYVLLKLDQGQYYKTYIPRDQVSHHNVPFLRYGLGIDVAERFR
jgi:hypothetical protein